MCVPVYLGVYMEDTMGRKTWQQHLPMHQDCTATQCAVNQSSESNPHLSSYKIKLYPMTSFASSVASPSFITYHLK